MTLGKTNSKTFTHSEKQTKCNVELAFEQFPKLKPKPKDTLNTWAKAKPRE